jgi:hypothetical protein
VVVTLASFVVVELVALAGAVASWTFDFSPVIWPFVSGVVVTLASFVVVELVALAGAVASWTFDFSPVIWPFV